MNHAKRVTSLLLVVFLTFVVAYMAYQQDHRETGDYIRAKDTIVLWYTDEALTDYLSSIALAYYEDTDVHVELKCVSGLEYLENINKASMIGIDMPDLYILANTSLEKAYLSGLATTVDDAEGILTTDHFSQTALNSVNYKGKSVAYPMYFDTTVFVYNRTYLEDLARPLVEERWENEGLIEVFNETMAVSNEQPTEDEADQTEDGEEEANPLYEYPIFVKEVGEKADEMVPATIADILNMANRFDAPEGVDSFFKWDVSDIFSNFFFIGNYVNLGGPSGDDLTKFSIYNENAIRCIDVYQSLNQFFSIDAASSTYQNVVQEFIEGKMLFTMATSDVISRLEAAKADGSFPYEYGVTTIPNMSDELLTRSFSITNAVAINGYSAHKALANHFARYICEEHADSLYDRTDKVPCCIDVQFANPAVDAVMQEYARSLSMPKAIELSNLWIELETAFTNIWTGEDANDTLRVLSEKIRHQITGEDITEERIEVEAVQLLEETGDEGEYIDPAEEENEEPEEEGEAQG